MDKKELRPLRIYDIFSVGDKYFLILKVKNQKYIKPFTLSSQQLIILRSIIAGIKKREDIFQLIKVNPIITKAHYSVVEDEDNITFYTKQNRKILKLNAVDGIILAIDNAIPIYSSEAIRYFFGMDDFIGSLFEDFDDLLEKGDLM
ncbi:hypothetical protein J7L48_03770 [bacterium]|nr:hypothetical protein [bacterium]